MGVMPAPPAYSVDLRVLVRDPGEALEGCEESEGVPRSKGVDMSACFAVGVLFYH